MGRSIFNIEEEYIALLNEIDDNDGILTEEQEKQLAINIDDFEKKMRNYTYLVKEREGINKMIDDEVKRLYELKKQNNNLIDRLKLIMRDALELFGDDGKSGNKVLDLGDIKFYTRKNYTLDIENVGEFLALNKDYVNVRIKSMFSKEEYAKIVDNIKELNGGKLPDDFKFEYQIDKRLLKTDIVNNKVEVSGVSVNRNDSLIIK